MNLTEARKRLVGGKRYWNRMVKEEYKFNQSQKEFAYLYLSEMMNTGSVEIPGFKTKTGNPVTF